MSVCVREFTNRVLCCVDMAVASSVESKRVQVGLILFDLQEVESIDDTVRAVFIEQLNFVLKGTGTGSYLVSKAIPLAKKIVNYSMEMERISLVFQSVFKGLNGIETLPCARKEGSHFFVEMMNSLQKLMSSLVKIKVNIYENRKTMVSLEDKGTVSTLLLSQLSIVDRKLDSIIAELSKGSCEVQVAALWYTKFKVIAKSVMKLALQVGFKMEAASMEDRISNVNRFLLTEVVRDLLKKKSDVSKMFSLQTSVAVRLLTDQIDSLLGKISSFLYPSLASSRRQLVLSERGLLSHAIDVGRIFSVVEKIFQQKSALDNEVLRESSKSLTYEKERIRSDSLSERRIVSFFIARILEDQKSVLVQKIEKTESRIRSLSQGVVVLDSQGISEGLWTF